MAMGSDAIFPVFESCPRTGTRGRLPAPCGRPTSPCVRARGTGRRGADPRPGPSRPHSWASRAVAVPAATAGWRWTTGTRTRWSWNRRGATSTSTRFAPRCGIRRTARRPSRPKGLRHPRGGSAGTRPPQTCCSRCSRSRPPTPCCCSGSTRRAARDRRCRVVTSSGSARCRRGSSPRACRQKGSRPSSRPSQLGWPAGTWAGRAGWLPTPRGSRSGVPRSRRSAQPGEGRRERARGGRPRAGRRRAVPQGARLAAGGGALTVPRRSRPARGRLPSVEFRRLEERHKRRLRRAEHDYVDRVLLGVSALLRDRVAVTVGGGHDVLMNPVFTPAPGDVPDLARAVAAIEEARAALAEDLNLNTRLVLEQAFLRLSVSRRRVTSEGPALRAGPPGTALRPAELRAPDGDLEDVHEQVVTVVRLHDEADEPHVLLPGLRLEGMEDAVGVHRTGRGGHPASARRLRLDGEVLHPRLGQIAARALPKPLRTS